MSVGSPEAVAALQRPGGVYHVRGCRREQAFVPVAVFLGAESAVIFVGCGSLSRLGSSDCPL